MKGAHMHRGRRNRFDDIPPAVLRPQLTAVPRAIRRPAPDHLGEPEGAIWKHVLAENDLTSELALDVLTTALEAHQRAREAGEAISSEGIQVVGRDGQSKVHPMCAVG